MNTPEGFRRLLEKLSSVPQDKLAERLLWMPCAEIMDSVHLPTSGGLEEKQDHEKQKAAQEELLAFVKRQDWSAPFAVQVLCMQAQTQLLGLVSKFRKQTIEPGMRTVSTKRKLE
jgi:hypothetical protein